MGERGGTKVGIEKRDDNSGLGKTEPHRKIFGTVLHQKGDDIARLKAGIQSPTRVAVHACVEFAVRKTLTVREESRRIGEARRDLPDDVWKRPLRGTGDVCRGGEGARPVGQNAFRRRRLHRRASTAVRTVHVKLLAMTGRLYAIESMRRV